MPSEIFLHCAKTLGIPYSIVEGTYKNYIHNIVLELQKIVMLESTNTNKIVLGMDDFTIRKGQAYITRIHT